MQRKIMQDITPPEKKGIRQIPVPDRPYNHKVVQNEPSEHYSSDEVEIPKEVEYRGYQQKKIRAPKVILWTIAVLAVIFVIFSVFSIFTQATLVITPKIQTIELDRGFTAYKDSNASTTLAYQVVTINKTASATVASSGEEPVSNKASGTIVVYNNYSSSSQKLIKTTRFETPTGLIYRIPESIVVPGRKKSGSSYIPGSVETIVYADESGDKYNIGLSDFTIPGFKGDERYTAFYARSKTPMEGGLVGTIRKVDSSVESKTLADLDSGLQDTLNKEASSEKPEGFIMFDNAKYFDFKSLPQSPQGSNQVALNRSGTLQGILFNNSALAFNIANLVIPGFDGSSVYLNNPESISFSGDNNGPTPWTDASLNFHLKGSAQLVWSFDESALKGELAGKSASELDSILQRYPSIKDAKVTIRPFWQKSFPEDVSKIKVQIVIPKP